MVHGIYLLPLIIMFQQRGLPSCSWEDDPSLRHFGFNYSASMLFTKELSGHLIPKYISFTAVDNLETVTIGLNIPESQQNEQNIRYMKESELESTLLRNFPDSVIAAVGPKTQDYLGKYLPNVFTLKKMPRIQTQEYFEKYLLNAFNLETRPRSEYLSKEAAYFMKLRVESYEPSYFVQN